MSLFGSDKEWVHPNHTRKGGPGDPLLEIKTKVKPALWPHAAKRIEVTMKDGTKYDGYMLSSSGGHIVMAYRNFPYYTVPREEVAKFKVTDRKGSVCVSS